MNTRMKLLVCDWGMYPYKDIIDTLKEQGHLVDVLAFPIQNHISDPAFEPILRAKLEGTHYHLVFSVNYYAVIATACADYAVPYAAWTCDAPLLSLRHNSIFLPTNYIFCFDKKEYQELVQRQVPHVFYLPLAGMLQRNTATKTDDSAAYHYDISFVGSLYEKNRYDEMCCHLPSYLCGYMDAAIEAQKAIPSGNLLPQMLSDDILADLMQYAQVVHGTSSLEELRLHFATSVLSYKVAADIRIETLNALANSFQVDLFTTSGTDCLWHVKCHPPISYHTELPKVFAHSKINLNFTIPNIENGIPLRVFDVLSAGGFLLTDYRKEICRQFENGKDLVVFEGTQDLLKKAEYYLAHEKERQQIAKNGQRKVQASHQYPMRLEKILQQVYPSSS